MALPSITTVETVEAWLRTNGVAGSLGHDQVAVAHKAAEAYVIKRVRWWTVGDLDQGEGYPPAPDDLVLAVCLLSARYAHRRNSPDGLASGTDEFGPVRVPTVDRDVRDLIGPYRMAVV